MKLLALSFPGGQSINNPVAGQGFNNLSSLLSGFFEIGLFLASFLAFIWFIWGAFQYLFAGGNKEGLAKARSRMTWAIVGLIIFLLAFVITQFIGQILQPKPGQIPLPGFSMIPTAYAQNPSAVDIGKEFGLATNKTTSLGDALGLLVDPAFAIATVAVVIYFLIGAFKYLTAGSDKNALPAAQAMITHALIGFVLLMLAFLIFQFVLSNLFGITGLQVIKQ